MKFDILAEEVVEPRCSHFGTCGGCRFQHIPYSTQLEQKESFVRTLFEREIDPIIPCEPEWRYRNKMEFSFGRWDLGLMKRGKRGHVVSLDECWLTNPWFIEVLKSVYEWWKSSGLDSYHPPSNRGFLRTLTLREGIYTGERMVVLTVSGEPDIEDFVEADAVILREQITAKKTPTRFVDRVLFGKDHIFEHLHDARGFPWKFKIQPASFFQPNTRQAEILYQKVLEFAEIEDDEIVFDLYCGTGSLGMFASQAAKRVIGIELVSDAVRDGQENLIINEVKNMEIFEGDVAEVLPKISDMPTTIFVDPPRAGLSPKIVKQIIELKPQKIVYVSCNPLTQVKNCEQFAESGYRVERLQSIDQFPHTPHIENIALLKLF